MTISIAHPDDIYRRQQYANNQTLFYNGLTNSNRTMISIHLSGGLLENVIYLH